MSETKTETITETEEKEKTKKSGKQTARRIVESALMIAVATGLSIVKLMDLPYGGSVTLASMLPLIIIAYRYGLRWGLLTGFVYGIIQQLLGLDNLSYVTTWQSVLAVILLDYLIAYAVTGIGGIFKQAMPQHRALTGGAVVVCILRYACHVFSGATVWAGLSIPTSAALAYSLGYNATYMIPETIVTVAAAYYIGSLIDFRNETIGYYRKEKKKSYPIIRGVAGLLIVAAVVFDSIQIFAHLQNEKTGLFDAAGLADVNWLLVSLVSGVAVLIAVMLYIITKKQKDDKKLN